MDNVTFYCEKILLTEDDKYEFMMKFNLSNITFSIRKKNIRGDA